ncbi:Cytochrome c oxidase subunit VII, partial [Dillenia turbinata]
MKCRNYPPCDQNPLNGWRLNVIKTQIRNRKGSTTNTNSDMTRALISLLLPNPMVESGVVLKHHRAVVQRPRIEIFSQTLVNMSEPPFVPRERITEKQKYFQSVHKHTYLKGRYDKITSVAIPAALAATSLFLIARGIYNMSHGIGKK